MYVVWCLYICFVCILAKSSSPSTHKTHRWSSLQFNHWMAMHWVFLVKLSNFPIDLHKSNSQVSCKQGRRGWNVELECLCRTEPCFIVAVKRPEMRLSMKYEQRPKVSLNGQLTRCEKGIYIWDLQTTLVIDSAIWIIWTLLPSGFWYRTHNPLMSGSLILNEFWGTEPMVLCDRHDFLEGWVVGVDKLRVGDIIQFGGGLDELTMIRWSIFSSQKNFESFEGVCWAAIPCNTVGWTSAYSAWPSLLPEA